MTVRQVRLTASRHRWRIATDTGWVQGWWALSEKGLIRAVRAALRSCGLPLSEADTAYAIRAARRYGYIYVALKDAG